jgi:hypothetical protein
MGRMAGSASGAGPSERVRCLVELPVGSLVRNIAEPIPGIHREFHRIVHIPLVPEVMDLLERFLQLPGLGNGGVLVFGLKILA